MSHPVKIKTALVSVYYKDNLEPVKEGEPLKEETFKDFPSVKVMRIHF